MSDVEPEAEAEAEEAAAEDSMVGEVQYPPGAVAPEEGAAADEAADEE